MPSVDKVPDVTTVEDLDKDALTEGHLSIEDTVCYPNYIELCTKLPLN